MNNIEQARELLAAEYDKAGERLFASRARSGQYDNDPDMRAIAAALRAAPEVCELRICETRHLALKPNQLYRFTVDPNCDACTDAAATAAPVATLSTITAPTDLRTKLGDA